MGGSSIMPVPTVAATTALAMLLVLLTSPAEGSGLSVGFYKKLCPKAERVVRRTVTKAFEKEPGTPADIIRLFFHDCFVRGCDASVLLESTPWNKAERESDANNPSLDGFEVISDAKEALEKLCPQTVSCADILALAARDSTLLASGLDYAVPTGRRDGLVSKKDEVLPSVPHPDFSHDQIMENFTANGFTVEEVVTLSGAHSIGTSHCSSFTDRLYNFSKGGALATDPAMPVAYAALLKEKCPPETGAQNDTTMVQLDDVTPFVMDNQYYKNLLAGTVTFVSDVVLLESPDTTALVEVYAREPTEYWAKRFAAAMVKVSEMEVLTGGRGRAGPEISRAWGKNKILGPLIIEKSKR